MVAFCFSGELPEKKGISFPGEGVMTVTETMPLLLTFMKN